MSAVKYKTELILIFPLDPLNCCGSRLPHPDTIPSAPFKRQTAGSAFYLRQGLSPKVDIAPPSRIMDFHLARMVENSLYVQLEWSAPGGDYDRGKGEREVISLYWKIKQILYGVTRCVHSVFKN